jgi:hypothetical protein
MSLMTWPALSMGLMVSARHVIGCEITPETKVQNAFDDVASTIRLSLRHGFGHHHHHQSGDQHADHHHERQRQRLYGRAVQGDPSLTPG